MTKFLLHTAMLCLGAAYAQTPVQTHGKLSVKQGHLVDAYGNIPQLRGISLSWSIWNGRKYYTPEVVDWLVKDFKVTLIRVSMAVEPDSGYLKSPDVQFKLVTRVIDRAIKRGIYVLMDWHDHHANKNVEEAKYFFNRIAKHYHHHPNIIYEIWNEPEQVSWQIIKNYAVQVIPVIRKEDPSNLIVVGAPLWDQDVDVAAADPIIGQQHIAYSFHFYASDSRHQQPLRAKADAAIRSGLPLFVTEWGVGEANGDGAFDHDLTNTWLKWVEDSQLSWANWNLTDKQETTALLNAGASVQGGWTEKDLTPAGSYIRDQLRRLNQSSSQSTLRDTSKFIVASYYFPNYHTGDYRHSQNPDKGPNWSEWELVKKAIPRFPNHLQPLVPQWGYTDEKKPEVMEQKIKAATSHAVNCFIFDWYMYEDGPFLNQCLDAGFLKASNVNDIQFALMWANHDWTDIHPYKKDTPQKLLYAGKISPTRFDEIGDEVVNKYFLKPNYLKIDGKAYFSIYDIEKFLAGFGSIKAARMGMDKWEQKARAAGLKGIHWNLVAWGTPILPGEKVPADIPAIIRDLHFNSATSYVWIHHAVLTDTQTDYQYVMNQYLGYWDKARTQYNVPYIPNVTMGWDPTPRCDPSSPWSASGYPFMNTIKNNTPENFKEALKITKKRVLASKKSLKFININCWNEWTEGSYLEPDTIHGMGYLDAVKDVFGKP